MGPVLRRCQHACPTQFSVQVLSRPIKLDALSQLGCCKQSHVFRRRSRFLNAVSLLSLTGFGFVFLKTFRVVSVGHSRPLGQTVQADRDYPKSLREQLPRPQLWLKAFPRHLLQMASILEKQRAQLEELAQRPNLECFGSDHSRVADSLSGAQISALGAGAAEPSQRLVRSAGQD